MARSTREELELASTFLKKRGKSDYAHALDAVLAPGGWTLLRGSTGSSADAGKSNLPITTTQDVKAALKAAASDMGVSLSAVAEDGYRSVLDGTWEPPQVKQKRSTAVSPHASAATVLNLRVLDSLRREVREQLPALSAKAGYRVSESSIVLPFLMDELGVQDSRGQETFGTMIGQLLRDHLMQEAERQQVTLRSVLQEGIQQVIAGRRLPDFKRAAKNTRLDEGPRVRLTIPMDADLLTQLNEIAPQLSEKLGRKIYPGTLAVALLKEKLGQPGAE